MKRKAWFQLQITITFPWLKGQRWEVETQLKQYKTCWDNVTAWVHFDHHSVSKQDISTCTVIQYAMGWMRKWSHWCYLTLFLMRFWWQVARTKPYRSLLCAHAFFLKFTLSFLKIKTQLRHCKKTTTTHFHLLIWWHCISQKQLHYEFSLTLLSLCLHIRADLASPPDLKWTLISHKC